MRVAAHLADDAVVKLSWNLPAGSLSGGVHKLRGEGQHAFLRVWGLHAIEDEGTVGRHDNVGVPELGFWLEGQPEETKRRDDIMVFW